MKYTEVKTLTRSVRRKEIMYLKECYSKRKSCLFCARVRGVIRKYDLYCCRNCFKRNAEELGFSTYYQ